MRSASARPTSPACPSRRAACGRPSISGGRLARIVRALLVGVAISVALTGLSQLGLFSGWETRALDAFVFLRDRVVDPEIVLVAIDQDTFRDLGGRQPLSRRYLADLGDFLLRSGARVVAFDVLLLTPSVASDDAILIAVARRWAIERPGALVFASLALPVEGGAEPRYGASKAFSDEIQALFGFANTTLGMDGAVRTVPSLLPAAGGGFLPAFSLAALAGYSGHTTETLARVLSSGDAIFLPFSDARGQIRGVESIPLARLFETTWRIDFVGPPGSFTTFPSGPLVQLARSGVAPDPDNPFREKIVVVGATFTESRDFYPTPTGLMAGFEIHANMMHTLLGRRALLAPHWAVNFAVLLGTCVSVALLSLWLRPAWVALVCLALIAGFMTVSYEAYSRGGYWLDFVAPLAGMMAYLQGSRLLARRRLRAAFGQYVSPEVMDRVLREETALGGEVRVVSVLMSDLRGFTTLSEKLPPGRVSEIMNEYFTAMVDVILAHRGMVNDFIGDGILAIYGAPLDDSDHAWHAVSTALAMQAALGKLNARWEREGRAPLAMGVAVHTGEAFAGNMGSPRKKKYSVLGDTVNTVARMEGLNRELSTGILISAATLDAVRDRVVVRDRGAVTVKGRTQPVELFELLGVRDRTAT